MEMYKMGKKDKKRHHIYLAGNISEDKRTYEWREKFIKLMENDARIIIVNPCANAFNRDIIKTPVKDGLEFTKEAIKRSQKLLRAKDYQLIKMCSVVVVNLALVNPIKPPIGTVQELCWAHDIFYLPIIAICGGIENIYTTHPWIDECCSAKVETVEEAVEMVKTFFLDY
jgi:hypothetical protein